MTYFFLSYARGHDDAYVEQFYDDLSQEIRRRTGAAADEAVGFLDTRDLALGTRWNPELADALWVPQDSVPAVADDIQFVDLCAGGDAVFREPTTRSSQRFPHGWGGSMSDSARCP